MTMKGPLGVMRLMAVLIKPIREAMDSCGRVTAGAVGVASGAGMGCLKVNEKL